MTEVTNELALIDRLNASKVKLQRKMAVLYSRSVWFALKLQRQQPQQQQQPFMGIIFRSCSCLIISR
jgi:hypothetical protein